MKKLNFIILFFAMCNIMSAQEEQDLEYEIMEDPYQTKSIETLDSSTSIALVLKAKEDRIQIRWAPKNEAVWLQGISQGYILERLDWENITTQTEPTFTRLEIDPIKPFPLEDWEEIVKEDKNAAVAGQCIYTTNKLDPEKDGLFEAADDLSNRYGFALLAADYSTTAALASGLYYADINPSPTESKVVLYRIYLANSTDTTVVVDTTYAYLLTDDIVENVPPVIDQTTEGDKTISLLMNKEFIRQYSGFFYEKSLDGGISYQAINEYPMLNSHTNITAGQDFLIFNDSIPENYTPYYYRISGINSFGERTPFSEPVMVMGKDLTPPSIPFNVVAEETDNQKVALSWDWEDNSSHGDLAGFNIVRSISAQEGYSPINEDILDINTRTYTDNLPRESYGNYYIVTAMDTSQNTSYSLMVKVKLLDTIPPAPPEKMEGKIDSNGVVLLSWPVGAEEDIMGYQVYFSNSPDHLFTQVTHYPLQDTMFSDTVKVNTLTESVFYKFVAIDMNYNYSEFSEILEVVRPDIVPPVPPLFKDYKVGNKEVSLEWIPSFSEDVIKHNLYRKAENQEWILVKSFTARTDTTYTQSNLVDGVHYTYMIEAEDDAGHLVPCPRNLTILARGNFFKNGVSQLQSVVEEGKIKLSWENPDGLKKAILYRAVNEGQFKIYEHISSNTTDFIDNRVKESNEYSYSIQVIYPSGKTSDFSDDEIVKL